MKQLCQISVVGAGLFGSSITLTILRSFSGVKTVIYGHRAITRQKAGKLGIADIVVNSLAECVANATRGIDKVIKELTKLKEAIKNKNRNKIEKLLENARSKRAGLINYKMKKKELL